MVTYTAECTTCSSSLVPRCAWCVGFYTNFTCICYMYVQFFEESFMTLVPEQLLKDFISWWSPGEYSMIDRVLGDALGVLSCQFCSVVLGYRCMHTLIRLLDRVVSSAFLTGCVFKYGIAHRRSVVVLCMLYKIRCNPMHLHYGALPSYAVCASAGYTRCSGRTSVNLCASSLQNPAGPVLFSVSLWNDLCWLCIR